MRIKVKLFATLQKNRFQEKILDINDGLRVRDIINYLGISEKDAAIIFINNRHCDLDTPLKEDDILAIFPPIGGG